MSDQKTIPKGLRENEVERGNFKKPPIPYIPVNNKIGKKVKSELRTFKVKLDKKKLSTHPFGRVGILKDFSSTSIVCWVTLNKASSTTTGLP